MEERAAVAVVVVVEATVGFALDDEAEGGSESCAERAVEEAVGEQAEAGIPNGEEEEEEVVVVPEPEEGS